MITLPRCTHRNNACTLRYSPVWITLGACLSMRAVPKTHLLQERCPNSDSQFCPRTQSKIIAGLGLDPASPVFPVLWAGIYTACSPALREILIQAVYCVQTDKLPKFTIWFSAADWNCKSCLFKGRKKLYSSVWPNCNKIYQSGHRAASNYMSNFLLLHLFTHSSRNSILHMVMG